MSDASLDDYCERLHAALEALRGAAQPASSSGAAGARRVESLDSYLERLGLALDEIGSLSSRPDSPANVPHLPSEEIATREPEAAEPSETVISVETAYAIESEVVSAIAAETVAPEAFEPVADPTVAEEPASFEPSPIESVADTASPVEKRPRRATPRASAARTKARKVARPAAAAGKGPSVSARTTARGDRTGSTKLKQRGR